MVKTFRKRQQFLSYSVMATHRYSRLSIEPNDLVEYVALVDSNHLLGVFNDS